MHPVLSGENSKEQAFHTTALKSPDLKGAASQAEYETILKVLKQVNYNRTKAAEMLKIDRKTLYNKIRDYESSKVAEG